MKTELTLICHAATHAMKTGRFPTSDDPIEAVDLVAAKRQVVTSPARAARETAAHSMTKRKSIIRSMISTTAAGTAVRFATCTTKTPQDSRRGCPIPASAPHGGESLEALVGRVMAGLDRTRTAART